MLKDCELSCIENGNPGNIKKEKQKKMDEFIWGLLESTVTL